MRFFGGQRIRRRHVRRLVWVGITAIAALAMIIATAAPAFRS
jgi:hypothetical protein